VGGIKEKRLERTTNKYVNLGQENETATYGLTGN